MGSGAAVDFGLEIQLTTMTLVVVVVGRGGHTDLLSTGLLLQASVLKACSRQTVAYKSGMYSFSGAAVETLSRQLKQTMTIELCDRLKTPTLKKEKKEKKKSKGQRVSFTDCTAGFHGPRVGILHNE